MRHITLEQVRALRPCDGAYRDAVDFFAGRESVEVTEEAAVQVAQRFNWNWLAFRFLGKTALLKYRTWQDAAMPDYNRAVKALWKRTACVEKGKYMDASAEFGKEMVNIGRIYDREKARAFARAYNEDVKEEK